MSANQDQPHKDWDEFARQHLVLLVTVLLRVVGNPAVAFDLAIETLATLRRRWDEIPAQDDERLIWALESSQGLLAVAVARGRVPSVERCRDERPEPRTLSIAEQQQIMRLAEQPLDLAAPVQDMVDALAREAPSPPRMRGLRCSPLVKAEPLPDRERKTDGA